MMQQPSQDAPHKKPKSQKLLPEQQQKQFTIKQVIGRGTFGVVYLAYWNTRGKEIAIKSIAKNPKFKNREIEILLALSHENIVELMMHYERFDEVNKNQKNYTNLVMDYVPATLFSIFRTNITKQTKLEIERIVDYSRKILSALAYLDQKCICHRDIKPSNVLIDEANNILKICDFGSAKQLKKGQKSITYICSRYYRAPQLVLGCSEYSTKIDIWSAGCVIAEMITLHPLFDGANNVDQIAKIISVLGLPTKQDLTAMRVESLGVEITEVAKIGLADKIKKGNCNCPGDLIGLVEKLVVYDPEKRLSAKEALKLSIFNTKQ